MTDKLQVALDLLDVATAAFKPSESQPLADMVLRTLAQGVSDQVHATQAVLRSRRPRAANVNARAAFEGAMDMLLLIGEGEGINRAAALVYALEQVETEELRARFRAVDVAMGIAREPPASPTPEEVVLADAEAFEQQAPGHGTLVSDALREARQPKRTRRHWSNLSRKEIAAEVERRHPSIAGIATLGDALYGFASMHSHPRLRVWSETGDGLGGDPLRRSRTADELFPVDLSTISADFARMVLESRANRGHHQLSGRDHG